VLGAWWLGHYAATTTFLDTFAYARRAAGLPATAIDWGLWKSLTDTQVDQNVMLEFGFEPMPGEVAIQALWAMTGPHAPVRSTIVAVDWTRLATAYRTQASLRIVDDLLPTDHDDSTDTVGKPAAGDANGQEASFNAALRRADGLERQRLLESYLRDQAASKLGLTPSRLDTQLPLNHLGLDSLIALELRTQIERDLGIVLPVPRLLDGPSVAGLAEWLGEQLSGAGPAPNPTAAADARATQPNGAAEGTDVAGSRWMDVLAQVPEVSDDDVDELLRQVLAAREGGDEG
jgi:phthiocerol/phenolphthiocerol synthesis type-I polyketide synthase B